MYLEVAIYWVRTFRILTVLLMNWLLDHYEMASFIPGESMLWSHSLLLLTSATDGVKFMSIMLLLVFYLSHLFFFLSLFFFCLLLDWLRVFCESTCWFISYNFEQWSRNSLRIVSCDFRRDRFLLFPISQGLVLLLPHAQCLENRCFIYFVCFVVVSGRRVNALFATLSWWEVNSDF